MSTIVILIRRNWVGVKGIQLRRISDVWEIVDGDDGGIAIKISPQLIHVVLYGRPFDNINKFGNC